VKTQQPVIHSVPVLSLRGAQRRSNPARWFATPSFLGLATTNRRKYPV
jgi:hypothetical protein